MGNRHLWFRQTQSGNYASLLPPAANEGASIATRLRDFRFTPKTNINRKRSNVRSVPIADKRLLGGGYMQTGITFEKELEPPYGKRALAYCW